MFEGIMLARRRELWAEIPGVFAFVFAFVGQQAPALGSPHVRVRSSARIDAHATYAGGNLRIEGTLTDDAHATLPEESVSVSLFETGPPREARPLLPCPRPREVGGSTAGIAAVRTDEASRFCVFTKMDAPRACIAHFAWGGAPLIEGATLELAIDPSLASIELRFDPEPTLVALEREPFSLDAVASFTDKSVGSSPSGLALVLTNELGTELGRGTTDATGRVRFELVAARVGPPGKGALRVAFDGGTSTAKALHAAEIERHARVSLSVPSAPGNSLPPAAPDESVSIVVVATTTEGERVASGSIEARVDGNPVGAATLENGQAPLVLSVSTEEGTTSAIRLRYEQSVPWYEPGDEAIVRLPVVASSPWRRIPLVLAGLAVVAWLSLGRAARLPSLRPRARSQRSTPTQPRVTLVRAREDAHAPWTGRVIDAHDATPLCGAQVEIVRPRLETGAPLARATADEAGRFELRYDALEDGDQIAASARLHGTLCRSVPAFGEIEIALVQRRRALLDRLIAWARERGAPYDKVGEPTPAQVAGSAASDSMTALWARKVERAAFGPDDVDALVERNVEEGAPAGSKRSDGIAR